MDPKAHEAARRGRLTGSAIRTVCIGSGKAKNTLAASLNEVRPFRRGVSDNMPAALRHGIVMEPIARADFWERHPRYEMMPDADFISPASPLWNPSPLLKRYHWDFVGVSPDGIVARSEKGVLMPFAPQELKCPYNRDELRKSVDGKWRDKWLHQIDWAMILTGLRKAVLVISAPYEQDESPYRYNEFWIEADDDRHAEILTRVDDFMTHWHFGLPYDERSRYKRTVSELNKRSKP